MTIFFRKDVTDMADRVKVVITDEQKEIKVQAGIRMLLRRCCHAVLQNEEFAGSARIGITFTDEEGYLRRANRELGGPAARGWFVYPGEVVCNTDKSPYAPEEETHIGHIVISLKQATEIAEKQNNTLRKHMAYITALGLLTLLGCPEGGNEMRDKAELSLSQLGLPISSRYYIRY